ncbi:large subunit of alpha-aminoadipate reductase [Polychaeton citri CBS 116435]|uniref:Alpha-aminoadipate reductase n=1 Tax=Polychaeton citri CBS 116435 TaxID=1314669 RepID=A0A9P4QGD2_9PEZI|nr:large subunit of alpha-aminoadipate reductase [Polychaeton citri CBS 116435]
MGSTGEDVRPDPTSDLNWSDYRGAIHELFANNAAKHPARLCVRETASSNTAQRDFSYQHIDEASNILSHHLVSNGVQRGEVVMVYAHRGVDLVVAVMGVLKAGATFSVIDPAYPPDRQIIYLDVAKPRALVVIEKASREAGPLDKNVREYISSNLQLRTEVPALRLADDGSLTGGDVDGKECLQPQYAKKTDLPGVVVGPDSTPTLSFTSGSEGRPKGVKGRHFSLAYYFPWMSERFNLTQDERFSMLSGIAHDPIQRDIFTPLFLGASLIVPPTEDITFDRLAKWASDNAISVTHLTPAMGQILLGSHEPKVISLKAAFFVGDVLLKRDCRRLQQLAPNCRIKNMYGTTETQRAVSYYEIPSYNEDAGYLDSMGDVIPAGKGMLDVQLLVVDREKKERQCKVGEIGEIYVRAGGLAEGYLGDDLKEQTASKFVQNWFVDPNQWATRDLKLSHNEPWREFYFGPRDRMYKSGDLGRYTSDGNVECVGRADDQVKIRGFRVELGEIDTHLSGHPLVRENVTLLRRDHNEEQILVSYYVPDLRKWREWRESQSSNVRNESLQGREPEISERLRIFDAVTDNVRELLKSKLPVYAVPTLFIPMFRLPLTPNGKVDRRALPFPAEADLLGTVTAASDLNQRTETESALAEIWATHLKRHTAETLPRDANFYDIGGDSIMTVQILPKINRKWDINLPTITMSRQPTLRSVARTIDRSVDPVGLRLDAGLVEDEDQPVYYSNDLADLEKQLPSKLAATSTPNAETNILLTGATGFLGAYIMYDLLMGKPNSHVYAHVRAKTHREGMDRLKRTCTAYGLWQDWWATEGTLEVVLGDLEKPRLGLNDADYKKVADGAGLVIHNGAKVHWLQPYESLRAANVQSTIECIKICGNADKPKRFAFVSSTSALDTDYYVEQSEEGNRVLEIDNLEGSRQGLGTGYGQTKWVSEKLVKAACARGLNGTIIRAGYVMGDPKSGVSNTDDFLVRMLKGCVQLGARPNIENSINMVPVTHVAKLAIAASLHSKSGSVVQVEAHPRLTFNDFLGALETYGYTAPEERYGTWKKRVEKYVDESSSSSDGQKEELALLGLYHMVTGDMPAATKAPNLGDKNAQQCLKADSERSPVQSSQGVSVDAIGAYIAFLIERDFMNAPPNPDAPSKLPKIEISNVQMEALNRVGGRGGASS